MTEARFNKLFSSFILLGMAIAVIIATSIKLASTDTGHALLLISAFGSLMGVSASVASSVGKRITFVFGLINVTIYAVVCMINWRRGNPGLGNSLMHFFYMIPMQFVGLIQWKNRGAHGKSSVKARRLSGKMQLAYSLLFVLGSVVAYIGIAKFDRSTAQSFIKWAVVLDVIPLVCNILGQILMSTAYMEQWIFWIGVNVFSIGLWAHTLASGDNSYALIYLIKYCFYLLNSLNGLRIWIGLSKPDTVCNSN